MVTGWELPSTMTESDWKQAGSFLMQVNQARQWWLGDWWNACKWGDGKAACEEVGVDYQTAKDCGWVATSFQLSRRRDKLTFSHHREVCPTGDPTIQDQLLDWCLSGSKRKSVRELRGKVQEYLEKKDWEDFDAEVFLDGDSQALKNLALAKEQLEESQAKCKELELNNSVTPVEANLDNLIPVIKELYEDKFITPAMARKISTMTDEGQSTWNTLFIQKKSAENQIKENELKIAELKARPEPEPKIIEKEVIPLATQAKLKKAETALSDLKKAERKAKKAHEDFNEIAETEHKLRYEISQLREQLKVNDPANIDASHAESFKDILDMLKNRLIRFEEDRVVSDHPMDKTWVVLNKTMEALSAFSDRAENLVCINPTGE
jgi:hypothetical protein